MLFGNVAESHKQVQMNDSNSRSSGDYLSSAVVAGQSSLRCGALTTKSLGENYGC
jgi:hypothetical protein